MGQYYNILMKEENKNTVVYNRDLIVNGKKEYTMAKLTEHSWWYNPMVNAIAEKIYLTNNPVQVIWMGDYACDFIEENEEFNGITYNKLQKLYERCWSDNKKTEPLFSTEFTLNDTYLVNHTKKQYIDCSLYYKNSVMKDDWCLHPLPLLTCIGNGLGGGDYRYPTDNSTTDLVGTWAYDKISISDNPINDYEEIYPIFKEKGWDD